MIKWTYFYFYCMSETWEFRLCTNDSSADVVSSSVEYYLKLFTELHWGQASQWIVVALRGPTGQNVSQIFDRITAPSFWTATKNNLVLTCLSLGLLAVFADMHQICAATHKLLSLAVCLNLSFWCLDLRLLNLSLTLPVGLKCQVLQEQPSCNQRGRVTVCSLLRWLQ